MCSEALEYHESSAELKKTAANEMKNIYFIFFSEIQKWTWKHIIMEIVFIYDLAANGDGECMKERNKLEIIHYIS